MSDYNKHILNWGGYRLLTLSESTVKIAREALARGEIEGFHVSQFHGSGQRELNALGSLPSVRALALQGLKEVDYSAIYGEQIVHLELVETAPWPAFDRLPRLASFAADAKGNDPKTLPRTLTALVLQRYRGVDLVPIRHMDGLQSLNLSQPGLLESLDGLPHSVSAIGVGNASRLKSINAIRNCNCKRIAFDVCRRIADVEVVGTQTALEYLMLSKLGEIPSISFIRNCQKLKFLSFPGTRVVDGELGFCKGIDYVYFEPHEHYTHALSDFTQIRPPLAGS